MRVCIFALAAAFIVASTAVSFAEKPNPDAKPAAAPSAKDAQEQPDEMICRRATLTGTLLPGPRICKSRKVWEQQQQDSKDLLNKATTRGLQGGTPGH